MVFPDASSGAVMHFVGFDYIGVRHGVPEAQVRSMSGPPSLFAEKSCFGHSQGSGK